MLSQANRKDYNPRQRSSVVIAKKCRDVWNFPNKRNFRGNGATSTVDYYSSSFVPGALHFDRNFKAEKAPRRHARLACVDLWVLSRRKARWRTVRENGTCRGRKVNNRGVCESEIKSLAKFIPFYIIVYFLQLEVKTVGKNFIYEFKKEYKPEPRYARFIKFRRWFASFRILILISIIGSLLVDFWKSTRTVFFGKMR